MNAGCERMNAGTGDSDAEDDEPEASTSRPEGKGAAPIINKRKGKVIEVFRKLYNHGAT